MAHPTGPGIVATSFGRFNLRPACPGRRSRRPEVARREEIELPALLQVSGDALGVVAFAEEEVGTPRSLDGGAAVLVQHQAFPWTYGRAWGRSRRRECRRRQAHQCERAGRIEVRVGRDRAPARHRYAEASEWRPVE